MAARRHGCPARIRSAHDAQRSSARWYQRPDNTHVTYDPNRTSLSGFSGQVNIGRIAGNWRFSTGLDTRSPGYEVNDAGFQQELLLVAVEEPDLFSDAELLAMLY